VRRGPVATVAPVAPIDSTYTYLVPDELADTVRPGARIEVPMGPRGRPTEAFCVDVSEGPWETTLRPVSRVLDARLLLSRTLLELGRWISRYYAAPLGPTLKAMLPAGVRGSAGLRVVRYVHVGEPLGDGKPTGPRQARVLALLADESPRRMDDLCAAAGCTPAVVRALAAAGRVRLEARREEPRESPAAPRQLEEPTFELNLDQRHAIDRILAMQSEAAFRVAVLFGVTGSGKTEVYVRAIRAAIAAGRQAIMLVPEIALTTQTVQRLSHRFERVAVLHSSMSDATRARCWSALAEHRIDLVIGTRSAVFAPCPKLGLIVVDEEQEGSFKNLAAPRYHTRDVAVKRAQLEGIPIVLGSATPSLETWHNVGRQPHFELLRLPRRVRGLPLPRVELIDMRAEHRERRGVHLLSRRLEERLAETLNRREQAVLLINRRGFASFLFCPACRTPLVCPNCSVQMVLHVTSGVAICHYCHERVVVPTRCPMAGCAGHFVRFGIGTQRVEAEIAEIFPTARVARLDSDAMHRPGDYARVLGDFEARRLDVLVGTQMVAKGLDFPFVSLVGVVTADTALAMSDFRASERTFQLVLQVAGRSGRADTGGEVVVQTFSAELPMIQRAVQHDYEGFAQAELAARRKAKLPPFTRLARIVVSDPLRTRASKAAESLARSVGDTLGKYVRGAEVFPPQPCSIERIRNQYRFEVLLRFAGGGSMLKALDVLRAAKALRAAARSIIVDVDPVALQ